MRNVRAISEPQQEFTKLLSQHLNRVKELKIHEREIAQRAGIDASTLSLIKQGARIQNPKWELRLRLAIALTENIPAAARLAKQFFQSSPEQLPDADWEERLKELKAAVYQSVIKNVRVGLPLFFDTAPFLIAERNGYFERLGLKVKLDYVKWHKVLSYLDYGDADNEEDLRLSVYNRDSIEDEGKKVSVAFCFPLSIYDPNNFALWVRDEEPDKKSTRSDQASPLKQEVIKFLERTHHKPKIIVSGSDMQRGAEQAFLRFVNKPVQGAHFILLDQYDALEAFLNGLGDAFVGGVPQRMMMGGRENIKVLVTGDEIGLTKQYNGIVCQKQYVSQDCARKAVGQILWCWYKALAEIEKSLGESSQFIADAMNMHASSTKYRGDDFVNFWRQTSFDLPRLPHLVARKIENDKTYTLKFYDQTLNFMDLASEIETYLPLGISIGEHVED